MEMSESKAAGDSGGKEGQKEHDQDKVCAGYTSDGQVCGKPVAEGAMGSIRCEICLRWFHLMCKNLNIKAAGVIRDLQLIWMCESCKNNIPAFRDMLNGGSGSNVEYDNIKDGVKKISQQLLSLEKNFEVFVETANFEQKQHKLERAMAEAIEKVEKAVKENTDKVTAFNEGTVSREGLTVSSADVIEGAVGEKMEHIATRMQQNLATVLGRVETAVKQNSELVDSVKDTVTGNKLAYAEILKKSISEKPDEVSSRGTWPSLPHKQELVQVQECMDRESRKCNVIISSLPEPEGAGLMNRMAADKQAVYEMFRDLNIEVDIGKAVRLGAKSRGGKPRLLLISTSTEETKWDVVRAGKALRDLEKYQHVYVNPDLTRMERQTQGRLRAEVRERRQNGENVYIYKGQIIVRKNEHDGVYRGVPMTRALSAHGAHREEEVSARVDTGRRMLPNQVPEDGVNPEDKSKSSAQD